jgi:hypothetical protein
LETSVFFDADHAHDHQTWRSITGIIVFVGSTPVLWPSKHQGCIATSTYTAEFVAMRSAIEEVISIQYMLRCLGILVTKPTNLYGDNFGVIQSATIPEGELKRNMLLSLNTMFVNQLQQDLSTQFGLNLTRILRMCVRRLWELLRSMKLFVILWHSVIFPFLKSRLCLRGGHVPGDILAIHPKRRSGSG